MNSARMFALAIAVGLVTLALSFAVTWFSQTGKSITRLLVLIFFRFACLLIGIARRPIGRQFQAITPTSQAASAFLLLSYIVSGTRMFERGGGR